MLTLIDDFLNKLTMYRLVLYLLVFWVFMATLLSALDILPYSALDIIYSFFFLIGACWIFNSLLAKIFKVSANVESIYITAFILSLIITPGHSSDHSLFLLAASAIAMASKYILAISKKHIFNPTAIAVVITGFSLNHAASWWVGTPAMLIWILLGGLLIARKTQRFSLIFAFLSAALVTSIFLGYRQSGEIWVIFKAVLINSPLLFFGFVMLTEPLTTPPTRTLQIVYGLLVGFLFAPGMHVENFSFTPELALVIGNIFSYIVSPKTKLLLQLKEKIKLAPDIYGFVFKANKKLDFQPGQYLEWTLGHKSPDLRGNRRYFTLASSPTENEISLGVKFHRIPSSFKKALLAMEKNSEISAGQLSGEFVLPKDLNKKLVFIAGGIGITPFRSMIKYLLDQNQKRPITLFYANRKSEDIVYKDIFDQAKERLNIKTIYTLTQSENVPETWQGETGHISGKTIQENVPDFKERIFYLSGPRSLILSFEKILSDLGVKRSQIKKDFFPGLV